MPSAPTERKLAAILSADVVGYSRLMAEDEAGTIRTLSTYREEVELHVHQLREWRQYAAGGLCQRPDQRRPVRALPPRVSREE